MTVPNAHHSERPRKRALIRKALPIVDVMLTLVAWLAASFLKHVRRIGIHRLPACRGTMMKVGI